MKERANKINRVSKSDSPERVRERNGNKERQGNREMSRERSSRSRVSLEDFVLIWMRFRIRRRKRIGGYILDCNWTLWRRATDLKYILCWSVVSFNLQFTTCACCCCSFVWLASEEEQKDSNRQRGQRSRNTTEKQHKIIWCASQSQDLLAESQSAAIFESPAIFMKRRGRAATAISFMFRVHYTYPRYVIVSEGASQEYCWTRSRPKKDSRTFRVAARAGNAHEPWAAVYSE